MLHQTNFSLETDRNFYFMNSPLKRIEHADNATVIVNPNNCCKTELDMSSISKPVADDDASAFVNLSNGGVTDLDISSFRKSKANDKLNNDCEFSLETRSTKSMVNESLASLKLVNESDLEVCITSLCQPMKDKSDMLSLSTIQKLDSPRNAVVASGDVVTETGTCISCSPENAGHIVRDIHVYEGSASKDKLSMVSDCSVVTEELPKFKTAMENEMNFHEHALETIADQSKMIKVKENKNIPEGHGASVVKGLTDEKLAQLNQDDKRILQESFILHSSSFEEKHVSDPIDWDENVKHRRICSRQEDCINQPSCLPSDKLENILKVPAEDDDKDRKSGTLSTDQKETVLAIPARNSEKESGHDLISHAECLDQDIRLDSSSASTHCLEDSPFETVMAVQFYGNNNSRVDSLSFETRSDGCFTSHDISAGESYRIASDESHLIQGSTQNGQNSKDKGEFSNGEMLIRDSKGRNLCTGVDNSPSQACPFLGSEGDHCHVAADLASVTVELTDGSIINSSSSNVDFSADDLVSKGYSRGVTSLLVPERMDKLQDSFSSNHGLGQEDSSISQVDSRGETVVAAEQKSIADDQISPVSLHLIKESIKICDLTEKTLIDTEAVNSDTDKKSAGDNIPASGLVSINADLNIKTEQQGHETDSGFLGHPAIEVKTEESIVAAEHKSTFDDQDTLSLTHSRKESDGTCEITEKLLIDAKTTNGSTSETSVVNNTSTSTAAESDTKNNATQRGIVTSGFSVHPVSSAYAGQNSHESFSGHSVSYAYAGQHSHESISGHPVSSANSGQNSHESLSDAFDDINGNNDMADSSRYTYPVSISGPISYSGPIPFSGSISLRSDSSTTSTRSFAFPILASEWNNSPVKMTQADPRYYRKKRGWKLLCLCGRSSSLD